MTPTFGVTMYDTQAWKLWLVRPPSCTHVSKFAFGGCGIAGGDNMIQTIFQNWGNNSLLSESDRREFLLSFENRCYLTKALQIPFSFSYFPLHFLPNPLSGMIFSLAILRHPEVFLWHPYGILHGFSAIRSFSCANSLRIVAILCPRVPPFIILKRGKARKTMPSRLLHECSCHLEFCNFIWPWLF